MENQMSWSAGYKTRGWFRVTLKKDVVFHLCMPTVLNQIKQNTGFEPVNGFFQAADPTMTGWFEMERIVGIHQEPEIDLFKVVNQIWEAMSQVYGPVEIECAGLTCLPFVNVRKIYEDQD
ncbi:hypothetical protein [Acinetobacter baumannii]|uniref:hypothetical protein n=1 Tax=Acinetobacter baumannii TaxID=470 RepID=UPI0036703976